LKKAYGLPAGAKYEEVLLAKTGAANLSGDGTTYDSAKNDQDLLIGDSAANSLTGGAGGDGLVGNKGNDNLNGGDGNDTYGFSKTDGRDVITDSDGQGQIVIDGKQISGAAKYVNATTWTLDGYTLTKVGTAVKIAIDASNNNQPDPLCACA
jgi:Ca2+-binding RTX toxin-like protein